jgi:hypothetical protein
MEELIEKAMEFDAEHILIYESYNGTGVSQTVQI